MRFVRLIWIAALLGGCAPQGPPNGPWKYDCYLGPLADSSIIIRWSDQGARGKATIGGRDYEFRLVRSGFFNENYKDGDAELVLDPELIFTPTPGAPHSVCNPGQRMPPAKPA